MSCPRRFLLALALFVVIAVPGPALAESPPATQADAHAGHQMPPPPAVEQPVDHVTVAAAELVDLNAQRKDMTAEGVELAMQQVEERKFMIRCVRSAKGQEVMI